MGALKQRMVRALTTPIASRLFYPLMRGHAVIFTLHRFRDPEYSPAGTDTAFLRHTLTYLRRQRFELLSLHTLIERLEAGVPTNRAVVFTIDDGYAEQAKVAAPLFAEFDCPVTTFVATGFLDRTNWFWWDKIEYVFQRTTRQRLSVESSRGPVHYAWDGDRGRLAAQLAFTHACKGLGEHERPATIAKLAETAEVTVPVDAPGGYGPMTWEDLRAAEEGGMQFGPHTVTHPILSRTDSSQSRDEITRSWNRVCEEARRPTPVFCYPNGQAGDYGDREWKTLRGLGFQGAVSLQPGYAHAGTFSDGNGRYDIPRVHFPPEHPAVVQVVSGLARLRPLPQDPLLG